jgi:hypothetical protein
MVYVLAMLLPLAFVPLLSPSRLAVGLPLFVTLCLNELEAREVRGTFPRRSCRFLSGRPRRARQLRGGVESCGCAVEDWSWSDADLSIGLALPLRIILSGPVPATAYLSRTPLGLPFWDSGSEANWRNLYVPGKRAELFPRVLEKIPATARVASTDFVHPRFTHFERSYDYSDYKRAVSNYELKVPDDTDYIVIDTQHPYSAIKSPAQVRELREHPDEWELLPDDTEVFYRAQTGTKIRIRREHQRPQSSIITRKSLVL